MAVGCGHTMQIAQMHAAENALIEQAHLFPILKSSGKKKTSEESEALRKRFFLL